MDEDLDIPGGWYALTPRGGSMEAQLSQTLPICILYNKTGITSIVLSWVLWIILANYRNWKGHGNPRIYNYYCGRNIGQKCRWSGDPQSVAGLWNRAVLQTTEPLTCGAQWHSQEVSGRIEFQYTQLEWKQVLYLSILCLLYNIYFISISQFPPHKQGEKHS